LKQAVHLMAFPAVRKWEHFGATINVAAKLKFMWRAIFVCTLSS